MLQEAMNELLTAKLHRSVIVLAAVCNTPVIPIFDEPMYFGSLASFRIAW
jgi:hypothetical protein